MITTFGKIVIIVGALVMFILALIVTKRIKELTRAITSISVSVSFQKEHLDVIKRAIIHCTNMLEKQTERAPRYIDEVKNYTSEQIQESLDAFLKEFEDDNLGRDHDE